MNKPCEKCGVMMIRTNQVNSFWNRKKSCNRKCGAMGRTISASAKVKMSLAKIGKPLSEEHKASLKGRLPWNKGIEGHRHTLATRMQMSATRKGKPLPWLDTKGENNVNWKGGITSENRNQRLLFKRTMQRSILERDNFTCQLCSNSKVYLQVDHIKRWSEYPELRFEPTNCRTLCMPCHYEVTFGRPMPEGTRWGFNHHKQELLT